MVEHLGLRVEVTDMYGNLPEFPCKNNVLDNSPTVWRYVVAVPRRTFRIKFTITGDYAEPETALVFTFTVDGKLVDRLIGSYYDELHCGSAKGPLIKDKDTEKWLRRPLTFQKIVKAETGLLNLSHGNDEAVKEIGKITVQVHRIEREGPLFSMTSMPYSDTFNQNVGSVNEKDFKKSSASQITKAGPLAEKADLPRFRKISYLDGTEDDKAYATFHFLYRSKSVLRELDVIEAETSPKRPREEDPDVEIITPERIRNATAISTPSSGSSGSDGAWFSPIQIE